MDSISIRERLREDRLYKKKGRSRAPTEIVAHDNRMVRMRQILGEIAKLARLAET